MIQRFIHITIILLILSGCKFSSEADNQILKVPENATPDEIRKLASEITPSLRQLKWHENNLSAIIYLGLNTYLNQEIGGGDEDLSIFNPTDWRAEYWVNILKNAGIKRVLITAKHYDGFCLWPTQTTDYHIGNSPFAQGGGDIIRDLADACHRANIDFGIYLSVWDRHEPSFGTDTFNEVLSNQIEELMTDYGEISEVWLDGTIMENPNQETQIFAWDNYFKIIREKQPEAVISVKGPDVRWIGTENGLGRETEWSVVPIQSTSAPSLIEENDLLIPLELDPMGVDINSQDELLAATHLTWYPATVNLNLRLHRYYHSEQDEFVKSSQELLDMYFKSIGRNAGLAINVSAGQNGLLPKKDEETLRTFGNTLNQVFDNNRMRIATIEPSSSENVIKANIFTDQSMQTYWAPRPEDDAPTLTISYNNPITFNIIDISEPISQGQRIEEFIIESWAEDEWIKIAQGTTIGNRRIINVKTTSTEHIRIIVTKSRNTPRISELGIYKNLPEVSFDPKAIAFTDNIIINLQSDDTLTSIHYTIDGSRPDSKSPIYQSPLTLNATTEIKAIAILPNGLEGYVNTQLYNKARFKVLLENAPDIRFTSGGSLILTDGLFGGSQYDNYRWLGFKEVDLSAIIDLNTRLKIRKVSVNFLHDIAQKIHLPKRVRIYASNSLKNWRRISSLDIQESIDTEAYSHTITKQFNSIQYRYLKVVADNIGTIPENEIGEGEPAWLFIDEITIE